MTSRKALFYSGILGLLGAAAMLVGDLLFYAHWGEMPDVKEAVHALVPARGSILLATSTHLHVSGLLGPVAAILYLFGAWHLYLNLKTRSRSLALTVGALFACAAVFSGTYHALWSLYGIIIQSANTQAVVPVELLENAQNYAVFMVNAVSIPIILSMFVLFIAILFGKSSYPRWMALFSPFLALVVGPPVLTPIAADLAPPYGALIAGAFYNFVMLVFFLLSLLCSSMFPTEGQKA